MKHVLALAAIIAFVFVSATHQPAFAVAPTCVFTGTLDATNPIASHMMVPVTAGETADYSFTPNGSVDMSFSFLEQGSQYGSHGYFGFTSGMTGSFTVSHTIDEIRVTLYAGTSLTYSVTVSNCSVPAPVVPVAPVAPVAPVIVEAPAVAAINDGRINVHPGAPIAVYCVDGGVRGYRIDGPTLGTLVLNVSAEDVAEISETPATNTLIASGGGIRLYRLTSGELQANFGPYGEGQEYVYIWSNCAPGSGDETTFRVG